MSSLRKSFVLVSSLLLTAPLETAGAQTNLTPTRETFAFVGVNVIPLAGSTPILSDQTVIVRDRRIERIGPRARVAVPATAIRIDGNGKYLMPGLADMHVHLEHFDDPVYLQLFLINGITTVRAMDGTPEILDAKRAAAAGTLVSPSIYSAGPVLDGSPPTRPEIRAVRDAAEARSAVIEQATLGYDFIKIYPNLSAESFRAIVATAKERGKRVVGHLPRAVALSEILAANVASIEHGGDYADAIQRGDLTPASSSRRRLEFEADSAKIDALASQLARSNTWVVPTIVLADRAVARDSVLKQWMADASTALMDKGIVKYFWEAGVIRNGKALDAAGWHLADKGRRNRIALVDAFRRAGARMLIGTDTPQPFVFAGASVHEELANFVAAGFTNEGALAVATRHAARFAGDEKLWGTVETGKRADLLLLKSNPLQDINATRQISGVMARGKWYPDARLQEMRKAVEAVAAKSQ